MASTAAAGGAALAHWPAASAVSAVEAESLADRRGDRAEASTVGAQRLHQAQHLALGCARRRHGRS